MRRVGVAEPTDEKEVPGIALLLEKDRPPLQQQGIAGLQHDVADLLVDASAVARQGDDHGIVMGPEPTFAYGFSDQRIGVGHHRLDEATLFCRSTTESCMPTNTRRSPACKRSLGDTAGRI